MMRSVEVVNVKPVGGGGVGLRDWVIAGLGAFVVYLLVGVFLSNSMGGWVSGLYWSILPLSIFSVIGVVVYRFVGGRK